MLLNVALGSRNITILHNCIRSLAIQYKIYCNYLYPFRHCSGYFQQEIIKYRTPHIEYFNIKFLVTNFAREIVSVLALCVVVRMFEPRSVQTRAFVDSPINTQHKLVRACQSDTESGWMVQRNVYHCTVVLVIMIKVQFSYLVQNKDHNFPHQIVIFAHHDII